MSGSPAADDALDVFQVRPRSVIEYLLDIAHDGFVAVARVCVVHGHPCARSQEGFEVLEVPIGLFVIAVDPEEVDLDVGVPVLRHFLGIAFDQLKHALETVVVQSLRHHFLGRLVFQRHAVVGEFFLFFQVGVEGVDGVELAALALESGQQVAGGEAAVAADLDDDAALGHLRRPFGQHAGFRVADHAAIGLFVVLVAVQQAFHVVVEGAGKAADDLGPPVLPGFIEKFVDRHIVANPEVKAGNNGAGLINCAGGGRRAVF